MQPSRLTLILGTSSISNIVPVAPLQEVVIMANDPNAPEFIVNQGLYYPASANYYGYYSTGFESPGEWDDHHRFFAIDGQDLNSPGLQTDGLQYVYYTPSYGYGQSPYNPYNSYIPGAVVGSDSSFIGTQQYIASSPYHQPVSSQSYVPIILQPGYDIIPAYSPTPSLTNTSGLHAPESSVVKYPLSSTSVVATTSGLRDATKPTNFQSQSPPIPAERPIGDTSIKPTPSVGNVHSTIVPEIAQVQSGNVSLQSSDQAQHGNQHPFNSPLRVAIPSSYGFNDFGSSGQGWNAAADRFYPGYQFTGPWNGGYGYGHMDMLGEKNIGPRLNKTKGQLSSSFVVKAFTNKAGDIDAQGNITINTNQYNREDFPLNYPNAKFFVIKSYSEDDVHKSIKYNVWSSTPNGNKRLHAAYEDSQRISRGKPGLCPIFLFFSVNASGQFCGVAEMVGPVDFQKDMDFWQQDKWTGSFPVKWHVVKDVPNTSFRHIVLENNENKPVTNSRDTQEILYIPGLNMLSIFKSSPLKASILDDFIYYEERQRIMYEEKSRALRNYENSVYFNPSIPLRKPNIIIENPGEHEKPDKSGVPKGIDEEANGSTSGILNNPSPGTSAEVSKGNTLPSSQPSSNGKTVALPGLSNGKMGDGIAHSEKAVNPTQANDADSGSLANKMGSLSINSGEGSNQTMLTMNGSSIPVDAFTVGTMPVKVNGFSGASSGTITVSTIPIEPKSVKQIDSVAET